MKTFYHIRVVNAKNREEAIKEVQNQNFNTYNTLCDRVITKKELLCFFNRKNKDRRKN